MKQGKSSGITTARAADVCRQATLSGAAKKMLAPDLPPRRFLMLLLHHEMYADGVRFLANWLPRPSALWWGCLCVRHCGSRPLPPLEEAALRATVHWVLDPSEENRQAAGKAGVEATLKTPAGCLARSTFWSGGSVAAPAFPVVPPKPFLLPRTVSAAILLASIKCDPKKLKQTQAGLLALGMGVLDGEESLESKGV